MPQYEVAKILINIAQHPNYFKNMINKINQSEPVEGVNGIAELLKEIEQNSNYRNYLVGLSYFWMEKYSSAINYLKKYIAKDPNSYEGNLLLGEIYIKIDDYSSSKDYLNHIVGNISSKDDFEKLLNIINTLSEKGQFDIAKELLSQVSTIDFEVNMGYPLAWEVQDLVESEMHIKVLQARLDERNKIIADLSHSLKNIIATVADPLENLRQTKEYVDITIEKALRGANLVREITNAMNYSLKGSIADFQYDAQNNQGRDSQTISGMVETSLRNSVANMFDTKYFSTFSKQYFPDKDSFYLAKNNWATIGAATDTDQIVKFIEKYLTKIMIELNEVGNLAIGNDKGSAAKLLTIIQEMILNAVKYSAVVKREKRFIRIKFSSNKKYITLSAENKFKPQAKVKTTGMGLVILRNFAEMLNTTLEIDTANEIYSAKFKIPNFWKESKT